MQETPQRMGSAEFRRELTDLMIETPQNGRRVVVERNGRPAGAWISLADLEYLQSIEKLGFAAPSFKSERELQDPGP